MKRVTEKKGLSDFAILSVLLAGISFGTTGTAQALYGEGINPLVIGSARLLVGASVLWLISSRVSTEYPTPMKSIFLASLGVASYQLAFFSAVHLTGVAIATITALGSSPIFTGILSWKVDRQKPARSWLIATAITTLGIITLNLHADKRTFHLSGVLLALAAGAGFASFNISGRKVLSSGYPLSLFLSRSFAVAALLISPFLLIQSPRWIGTVKGFGLVIWLGIIATALAYTLYGFGLKHLQANTAATLVLAEPVTATLLSLALLHNHLNVTSWFGVAIVMSGLLYLGLNS